VVVGEYGKQGMRAAPEVKQIEKEIKIEKNQEDLLYLFL
jgi:hypothetical protein